MRKIPLNYSLYEPTYNGFPHEQYYIILFDIIASKYTSKYNYSSEIIEFFKNKLKFYELSKIVNELKHIDTPYSDMVLLNETTEMMIVIKSKPNKKDIGMVSLEFLYNNKKGDFFTQLNFDDMLQFKIEPTKSNIHLIKSDGMGLDVEEFTLNIPDCDIKMNYGDTFFKLHEIILERLNTPNDKGIVLFHGEPGTGKTTYIKILTKLIKDKKILFIPPSMAEILSDPSIIPFLMNYTNSVLIIEDAEKVIGDRNEKGSQSGVSNILNLTDGILGDCLNIQVIATFNMPKDRIDRALLRKGRLICEHRFDKLNVDNTNLLLKHIGKNTTSNIPLTLADIYNIEIDINRSTSINEKPIGFKKT